MILNNFTNTCFVSGMCTDSQIFAIFLFLLIIIILVLILISISLTIVFLSSLDLFPNIHKRFRRSRQGKKHRILSFRKAFAYNIQLER